MSATETIEEVLSNIALNYAVGDPDEFINRYAARLRNASDPLPSAVTEDIMIDRDPDDEMGYPWHVIVDMRRDDTTANYEWSDAVVAKLGTLDFQADPETSCSYFYLKTEADAKFVATVVRSVWAQGLPS